MVARLLLAASLGVLAGACFDPTATEGTCCQSDDSCGAPLRCFEGYCLRSADDVPTDESGATLACVVQSTGTDGKTPPPTTGATAGTGSAEGTGSTTSETGTSGSDTSTGSGGSDTSTSG